MKVLLRIIVLLCVLSAIPVMIWGTAQRTPELEDAKRRHDRSDAEFRAALRHAHMVESHLTRLTSSEAAVEKEIRQQLRMIKPGETLVLVEIAGEEP